MTAIDLLSHATPQSEVDANLPDNLPPCALPCANSLRSYWQSTFASPFAEVGKHDPLPAKAVDVCIIGSGISGICAAYHLVKSSQKPLHICILEARGFCSGATSRNGGHLTQSGHLSFLNLQQAYGLETAKKAVHLEEHNLAFIKQLIADNGWGEEVDLVEGGSLHLFATKEEELAVREQLAAASDAGIESEQPTWLSPKEVQQQFGTNGTLSGAMIPGNNLHPLKLVSKIFQLTLDLAKRHGHTIGLSTYTPVLSVQAASRGLWSVKTSAKGALTTRVVIHATNGYATSICPELASGPRRILPCRGQIVAAKPPAGKRQWLNAFSFDEGFEYFFQRPSTMTDDRPPIILGGGRNKTAFPFELGISDDSSLNATISIYLRRFLPILFPETCPTVDISDEWSGVMGFSLSRDPTVSPRVVEGKVLPGQFLSCGFAGHGMPRCGACAEAVAGFALDYLEGRHYRVPAWLPQHYLLPEVQNCCV